MSEDSYDISFIKQSDFEKHVSETMKIYNETLKSIDLQKFNANVIDPIKLTFDSALFKKTIEETIEMEIARQRDKTNTNAIGYFHQKMFKFIKNCVVPAHGFDVIYTRPDGKKVYVEMKNKHNTMNSKSSQKTYMGMQHQILREPTNYCYLVEVIAPHSRNIPWKCSVDNRTCSDDRIRRVSIDKFYEIVTGIEDAFLMICKQLPITIDKLIKKGIAATIENDTVIDELSKINPDTLKALYLIAFETYNGFDYYKKGSLKQKQL